MRQHPCVLLTLFLLVVLASACNSAVSSPPMPTPDAIAIYKLTARAFNNMASLHSYHLTLSIINKGQEINIDGDFGRTTALFTQQVGLQRDTVLNINEDTYFSTDRGQSWTKARPGAGPEVLKTQQDILNGVASDIEGGMTVFVGEENTGAASATHLQVSRYDGGGIATDVWIGNDQQLGDIVSKIHESIMLKDTDEDITGSYSEFNKPLDLQPPAAATEVVTSK